MGRSRSRTLGVVVPMFALALAGVSSTPAAIANDDVPDDVLSISSGVSSGMGDPVVISPTGNVAVFFEYGVGEVTYFDGTFTEEAALSALIVDLAQPDRMERVELDPLPAASATARFSEDGSKVFIGANVIRFFPRFVVFDTEEFTVTGETVVAPFETDSLELSPVGPWYSEILYDPGSGLATGAVISSLETNEAVLGFSGDRPPSPWFSPTNDRAVFPAVIGGKPELIVGSFLSRDKDVKIGLEGRIDGYPGEVLAESSSGSLFAITVREKGPVSLTTLPPITEVVFIDVATDRVRGRVPDALLDGLNIVGFSPDDRFAINSPLASDYVTTRARLELIEIDTGEVTVWEGGPEIASTTIGRPSIFSLPDTGESFVVGFGTIQFVDWDRQEITREIIVSPPETMGQSVIGSSFPVFLPEEGELLLPWSILTFGSETGSYPDLGGIDWGDLTTVVQRVRLADSEGSPEFFISGYPIGFDATGSRFFVYNSYEGALEVWDTDTRQIDEYFPLDVMLPAQVFDPSVEEEPQTYRALSDIEGAFTAITPDATTVYFLVNEIPTPATYGVIAPVFHVYALDTDTGEQILLHSYDGTPVHAGFSPDTLTLYVTVGYDDVDQPDEFLAIDVASGEVSTRHVLSDVLDRSRTSPLIDRGTDLGVLSVGESFIARDPQTGETRVTLPLPTFGLDGFSVSTTGSLLATETTPGQTRMTAEHQIHLLPLGFPADGSEAPTFAPVVSVPAGQPAALGFDWASENLYVYTDGTLTEYDPAGSAPLREASVALGLPGDLEPSRLISSPDGHTLWVQFLRQPDQFHSIVVPVDLTTMDWTSLISPPPDVGGVEEPPDGSMPAWWWVIPGGLALIALLAAWAVKEQRRRQGNAPRSDGAPPSTRSSAM